MEKQLLEYIKTTPELLVLLNNKMKLVDEDEFTIENLVKNNEDLVSYFIILNILLDDCKKKNENLKKK